MVYLPVLGLVGALAIELHAIPSHGHRQRSEPKLLYHFFAVPVLYTLAPLDKHFGLQVQLIADDRPIALRNYVLELGFVVVEIDRRLAHSEFLHIVVCPSKVTALACRLVACVGVEPT